MTQLQEWDRELLARFGADIEMTAEQLVSRPDLVDELIGRPAVFDALFATADQDPLLRASPHLVFSVLLSRVARDLEDARYVEEWLGPRLRVPVFDANRLHEFVANPGRRAFLTELLASYTKVASGVVWFKTARGWRRRRYSELDPLRLAQMLEVVPAFQRPAIHRRLGDLALFLSGVFPDHAIGHGPEPRHWAQIERLLGGSEPGSGPAELLRSGGQERGLRLLEWLGRRAYRLAAQAGGADLEPIAAAFGQARRVLNVMAGRYLFPRRETWFGAEPG
jgi:hypothetical protein